MKTISQLCYIRWVDANYQEGEYALADIDQRLELSYVGWLVKDTEHAVTLSLECPTNGSTRNPFSIPRSNILEMRTVNFTKAFPKKRKSKDPKEPTCTQMSPQ